MADAIARGFAPESTHKPESPMPSLTRDQILQVEDVSHKLVPVAVPEWGGTVNVRTLTAGERGRMEQLVTSRGTAKVRAIVAATCIADDEGKPLFTEGDVEALDAKSSKALDRILKVADDLNAVSPERVKELGEPSPTIRA